jgi:threonine dehydrogenase-like Zn-dependent dehydrogenase
MTSAAAPVSTQREPELAGQTVVVIGGSAGIGLETARRARAEGADVILTGRDPERLERAARDVDARSTAAFDANDAAALRRFFDGLPDRIDHVMITAAAPVRSGPRARARADSRQPHRRRLRRHPAVGSTARRSTRGAPERAAEDAPDRPRRQPRRRRRARRPHHGQHRAHRRDVRHRRRAAVRLLTNTRH